MSEILNIPVIDTADKNAFDRLFADLRDKLSPKGDMVSEAGRQRTIELFGEPLSPQQVVERICADVRRDGLAAVLSYTKKLDGKQLDDSTFRVSQHELAEAHTAADPEFLATVRRIKANVEEFQTAILNSDVEVTRTGGAGNVTLTQRYLPMKRIGVCVPGGAAAYPSTVLMTAVPAKVAGVPEVVVVCPPTEFGGYNTHLLATCHEIGVNEVYRIGGAQAVAAMAYGVDGLAQVDKIVGPGNLFVALAKRFVFGEVDIDSIAGPSEVIVLADESANPAFVAADLISQAEHSPGSGVLITWHRPLIDAVKNELSRQLASLERGDLATTSLNAYGALICAESKNEAAELTDRLATEHLHISTENPHRLAAKIQNAGAIFLGHHTPVALGDYLAGPSHVLPTGGTARFANGLCSNDFLKRSSMIQYDADALANAQNDIAVMTTQEGLTAHRASVDVRLSD